MDQVDEIKQKIDIVDLVSGYLTLKKAGRNYRSNCPFHKEKTPSFMVSPDKQIWYCFGCNKGGDAFSFVEQIEGLDFPGALTLLADRTGIVLDHQNIVAKGKKDKYFEIMTLASRFFSYILNENPAGQEALSYLEVKRKMSKEMIKSFKIGYAPNKPTLLKDFLMKKGYGESDLTHLGLTTKNFQNQVVDKFKGRVIFPIENSSGKIIGFGGRILKTDPNSSFTPPKYLNSPQSDIYDKSSSLYGLYQAKEMIRQNDLAIVVEGYLDVISSHQVGIKNVVASSGTALTSQQVKILSRYTKNIAFAFDADEAGKLAMKRALEMTRLEDISVKAIPITSGKDPDELIKMSPDKWKELTMSPISLVEFFYNTVIAGANTSSVEGKKAVAQEFLPTLAQVSDPIERAFWIKKISHDLGTEERYISDAIRKVKQSVSRESDSDQELSRDIKSYSSRENLILGIILAYDEIRDMIIKKVKEEYFIEEKAKDLYKKVVECYNSKDNSSYSFIDRVKGSLSKDEKEGLDLLSFWTQQFFDGMSEKQIEEDSENLLSYLETESLTRQKRNLEKEISLTDKTDREKIKKLLKQLQDLI